MIAIFSGSHDFSNAIERLNTGWTKFFLKQMEKILALFAGRGGGG
jgi:hypothetical protein